GRTTAKRGRSTRGKGQHGGIRRRAGRYGRHRGTAGAGGAGGGELAMALVVRGGYRGADGRDIGGDGLRPASRHAHRGVLLRRVAAADPVGRPDAGAAAPVPQYVPGQLAAGRTAAHGGRGLRAGPDGAGCGRRAAAQHAGRAAGGRLMSDAPKGIEPRFDELIHAPTRLSIVALLAAADWADFTFVRDSLSLSDSALSKQISILEQAGYVTVRKTGAGRSRRTHLRLSPSGRRAFGAHAAALREIITDADARTP